MKSETQRARNSKGCMDMHFSVICSHHILTDIATKVILRHETFIDPEVLDYLLKKLRGQRLTPRQEECAALIAKGLSNDDIALRMGYLNTSGKPNIGPLENLVSELYSFFGIEGAPSDPGRRVMLAHAYEAYSGQRSG